MPQPEKNFILLKNLHNDYLADRPIMDRQSQNLHNAKRLLVAEINELNGHAEYGMSLQEYRVQEVSDIGIFALGICISIGDLYPLESQLDRAQTDLLVPVFNQETFSTAESWSPAHEAGLDMLKHTLRDEAKSLNWLDAIDATQPLTLQETYRLKQTNDRILEICWAMFALLDAKPSEAMIEKIARNHVKHSAYYYNESAETFDQRQQESPEWWSDNLMLKENESEYTYRVRHANRDWKSRNGNEGFYETRAYAPAKIEEAIVVPAPELSIKSKSIEAVTEPTPNKKKNKKSAVAHFEATAPVLASATAQMLR